jgi:hypothetical protein
MVLLSSCSGAKIDSGFSIEGAGYKCTLYETDIDDRINEKSEPFELLWSTNFHSDGHFNNTGTNPSEVKIRIDTELRTFIETSSSGGMLGAEHNFEEADGKSKLTILDFMSVPSDLKKLKPYFLNGSLLFETSSGSEHYSVRGLCEP